MTYSIRSLPTYFIFEKLGEGSYAKVFDGIDYHSGQEVAIKTYKNCDSTTIDNEHAVLVTLQDIQGIPKLYAKFQNVKTNEISLVIERFTTCLSQVKSYVLDLYTIAQLAIDALKVLKNIHGRGFVHRDIKSANFVFDPVTLEVHLIDFGLAIEFAAKDYESTYKHRFVGSLIYASVNVHDKGTYMPLDDIWSYYIMLLNLFNIKIPWAGADNSGEKVRNKKAYSIANPVEEIFGDQLYDFIELFDIICFLKSCKTFEMRDYDYLFFKLENLKSRLAYDYSTESNRKTKTSLNDHTSEKLLERKRK